MQNHSMLPKILLSLLAPDTKKPWSKTRNIFTFMPSTKVKYYLWLIALLVPPAAAYWIPQTCIQSLFSVCIIIPCITFPATMHSCIVCLTAASVNTNKIKNNSDFISYFNFAQHLTISYFDLIHKYFYAHTNCGVVKL